MQGEKEEADRRRTLFSSISSNYDFMNDALSLGAHRAWKSRAVYSALGGMHGVFDAVRDGFGAKSSSMRDVRVLDLCCGSGDLALIAATALGQRGSVTGVDFSPELLAIARQKEASERDAIANLAAIGLGARKAVEWVEGDALHLVPRDADDHDDGGGGGDGEVVRDRGAKCPRSLFERESFDAVTMGYGLRNIVDIRGAMREMLGVLRPGGRAAVLDFNNIEEGVGVGGTRARAVKSFQYFMLENVVVPAARALELGAEYEYLKPSIEAFPCGREQERIALETGFRAARHEELAGGLMGLLVLTK